MKKRTKLKYSTKKKSKITRKICKNPQLPSRIVQTRDLLPILKKVLVEIGYHKRDIQVEIGEDFYPAEASSHSDGNRGVLAIIDVTPGKENYITHQGNYGGKAYTKTFVDDDENVRPIYSNMAVIFASIGGAGDYAKIRMHPKNFALQMLSGPQIELLPQEQMVLNIINSITSAYRKEYFSRYNLGKYAPENPIIQSLIQKKLIAKKGPGIGITTEGKNLAKNIY